MQLKNIAYFVREASKSMSRNRILSIATVSTVTICVLILGMAVLLTLNTTSFLDRIESDIEMMAFLDNELDATEIAGIEAKIKKIEGIDTVDFISREKAMQDMQEHMGENSFDLQSTLGDNPLPNSFAIKAIDPHSVPELAVQIEKINGIYKVNYGQEVVVKLFTTARWVRLVCLAFIVLLALGAVFLIATTIRLAVFSRRKEIYLMKLIGSTDWFIRWPFFIEGIILGSVGALLSIIILGTAYQYLLGCMESVFFISLINDTVQLLKIYLGLFAAGAVLGIIGTGISLNRYLDV